MGYVFRRSTAFRVSRRTKRRGEILGQERHRAERQLSKYFSKEETNINLFAQIKTAVSIKEAAEHYGLKIGRGNMVCCPFHADRTPSMKLNEDYFYCFGCGATGDVIDLVAKLFNLSSYDAAKKLADDFGIDPDKPPAAPAEAAKRLAEDFGVAEQKPSVLARLKRGKTQMEAERHSFRVLRDYFGILQDWKEHCAPQLPEDPIDPRYAEACHMLDRIGNMLDILISGTPQERGSVVADMQKDNRLGLMEERNRQIKEDAHEQS